MKENLIKLMQSGKIELRPTQDKICFPIIERIYKKMKINLIFSGINVIDGLIIDGDHRYLASLLANRSVDN